MLLSDIIGNDLLAIKGYDGLLCNKCFLNLDFIDSLQKKISNEKDKIKILYLQTTNLRKNKVKRIVLFDSQSSTEKKVNEKAADNTQSSVVTQSIKYQCPNCKELFKFVILLRIHLIKKHCIPLASVDELVLKCALSRITLFKESRINHKQSFTIDLSCLWCEAKYTSSSWSEYYKHISSHLQESHEQYCKLVVTCGIGNVDCKLCSSVFKTVKKFEKHYQKIHYEYVENSCLLCEEKCLGYSALLRHVNHHILGFQQCTLCPTKYSSQDQSFSHLESFHNNKYVVKCIQCGESFKNYEQYDNHRSQHIVKGDIDLSKHRHFQLNSSNTTYKYKCEECGNNFKIYGALIAHQVGHYFGIYHCPHCRLKYSKIDQISKHLLNAHPNIKGLECKICANVYKTYETYFHHLRLEHPSMSGGVSAAQNCNVCFAVFENKTQLYRHKKLHHSSKKLYSCDICGAKVQNLNLHMNNHTRRKVYSCNDCGIQYFNYSSLQLHRKRKHLGNSAKKHQCNICDKLFVSPIDLKVHISRVHKGERNYTCEFCMKNYKSQSSLTYHRRMHTGEKPHVCCICNIGFENPSFLKTHVEKDHNATYVGVYKKKPIVESQKVERVHINVPEDMKLETVNFSSGQNNICQKEIIYVVN